MLLYKICHVTLQNVPCYSANLAMLPCKMWHVTRKMCFVTLQNAKCALLPSKMCLFLGLNFYFVFLNIILQTIINYQIANRYKRRRQLQIQIQIQVQKMLSNDKYI